MKTCDKKLAEVLGLLKMCRGVLAVKLLSNNEKKQLLKVEAQAEDRVIFGICTSFNEGLREALNRVFTVATVIQTSDFTYPHHPYMRILYGDRVVGEEVCGEARRDELRRSRDNLFLWDAFVLYRSRLPRETEAKRGMRMVYGARPFPALHTLSYVENSVLGVPSGEGDTLLKRLLDVSLTNPMVGTCVVGFNIKGAGNVGFAVT